MRAGIVREWGGPEAIEIAEVSKPPLIDGSVLVRLHAAGLNRADVIIRKGGFDEAPRPIILGVEGAGDVAELGAGVESLHVGQRVVINPMLVCNKCAACRAGMDNACLELRLVGEHVDGTYAEYIVLPERNVVPAPESLSYPKLAASVVAFMTAWHMLRTRAKVQEGETVVVVGAGSGVGSGAVQVAKLLGADVIATTSTAEKERRLKELGADHVINYRDFPEFDEIVLELTDGLGADVVHETVGRATVQRSVNSIRHGGRLVGMGSHTGSQVELNLFSLYRREIDYLGSHTSNRGEIEEILAYLEDGSLQPVVDSVFPLDGVGTAHVRLDADDRFGKVVLSID